jgi:hypothetical protein
LFNIPSKFAFKLIFLFYSLDVVTFAVHAIPTGKRLNGGAIATLAGIEKVISEGLLSDYEI